MSKSIKINNELTGFHAQDGVLITNIGEQQLLLTNKDIDDLIEFLALHKRLLVQTNP